MVATELVLTAVMAALLAGAAATITRMENWRSYTPTVGGGGAVGETTDGHREKPGGIAFAVFAGIYYWFPIYAGRWYQRKLAKAHFWLTMIGTNITFFPMILLGYAGMPRRYATYDVGVGPVDLFALLHQLATIGVVILVIGQLLFLWNIVTSWPEGPLVTSDDPWNLDRDGMVAREFEWFEAGKLPALADGGERVEDEPTTRSD